MERYIGKMLDNRYEILEIIGQGGMAVVFKAKCHRLNRMVAIKVLKPDLAGDAEFRRRFHDESQAVAMLSHPNIVSVYDVSRGSDLEYIVMELIDGITLKQYMERRGQLNWREALHFITQVMKGLSHAHSRGIIHRDIKPQNIMVLRDGSVKVADFGIACLATKQTIATKEAMGSVHYISPEQAKGDRTDERSDIYSAGVVLYEMLTSRLPFDGDTPVSVAIQHFSAVPLNPREIKQDIPEALEQICMKAMTARIDQRYANADEMIHDLEEFRRNPEISFDYDLSELRGVSTDEPTQAINSRQLQHKIREERRREAVYDDGDDDDDPPSPIWKKLLLIVACLAVGAALVVGLYKVILGSFTPEPVVEYKVPNIVGMTVEEAEAHPDINGIFEIVVIATLESEEERANVILEQDPIPEKIKKKDFFIEVKVSAGARSEEMPDVTDYERTSAKLILDNLRLDLQYTFEDRFHDVIEAGHVISTDPVAGTVLSEGDTILLLISKGPEIRQVKVPSFVGMTPDIAQQSAAAQGLVITIIEQEDEAPAGMIIDQSVAAETTVPEGTAITLTMSMGMPETDVPVDENGNPILPPDDGGTE